MLFFPRSPQFSKTDLPFLELLTVIAVIGILIAILIPVAGAVRMNPRVEESFFERSLQEVSSDKRIALSSEDDCCLRCESPCGTCDSESVCHLNLDASGEIVLERGHTGWRRMSEPNSRTYGRSARMAGEENSSN